LEVLVYRFTTVSVNSYPNQRELFHAEFDTFKVRDAIVRAIQLQMFRYTSSRVIGQHDIILHLPSLHLVNITFPSAARTELHGKPNIFPAYELGNPDIELAHPCDG
jgi:hypothetical protein